MPLSRRRFALTAAGANFAALAIPRFPADAAEFSYKMSTDNPASFHATARLLEIASRVRQDTNGRFEIRVFPANQLGSSSQEVVMIREGAVEMSTASDLILATTIPVAGITATPFVFSSVKDAFAATAGPLGKYLRNAIGNKLNAHVFDQEWTVGFRQMINGIRPLYTPADMKGLKVRSPAAPVITAMFKAFGASPTTVEANEMYVALQTHLVDGIELPLTTIDSYKIYEVQKYVSITNHIWTGWQIVMNGDAWNRLPKNIQSVVERRMNEGGIADAAQMAREDVTIEGTLKGHGMVFNQAQIPTFREALQRANLYTQWRDLYGAEAWALLERSAGKLT